MSFHVGQKVRCTHSTEHTIGKVSNSSGGEYGIARDATYPVKDGIYTVRHVNRITEGRVLILLEEVQNGHLECFIRDGLEPGFYDKYFEAVEEAA